MIHQVAVSVVVVVVDVEVVVFVVVVVVDCQGGQNGPVTIHKIAPDL